MAIVSLKHKPFQNSHFLPTALFCFKLQNKYINKAKVLTGLRTFLSLTGYFICTNSATSCVSIKEHLKDHLNHLKPQDFCWPALPRGMNICCSSHCLRIQGLLCICQERTLRMLEEEGNPWGTAMVVWKGSLSLSMPPVLKTLWKALWAYERQRQQSPAWCACTARANGKQIQINSLFVHRFFFQADVQIFTTWVQSRDVLHLYFLKACRDTLEAPQWFHYCQSASALSLAARKVLKIYITVMGHEQIWLENIITFPKGLHTVIQKRMAKLLIKKKNIFHPWKNFFFI